MRPRARCGAVFAWLIAGICPLVANAQHFSFKYYGQEEGLTNLDARSIFQDSDGYIWIGTMGGLFRYDGWRFQQFGEADGLPLANIWSFDEDRDRTLWVATSAGLLRRRNGKFETVFPSMLSPDYRCFTVDKQGRVCVGTSEGLLMKEPGDRTAFRKISSGNIFGVFADASGDVWFSKGARLCRLHDHELTEFGPEHGVPDDRWTAIIRDGEGRLWAGGNHRMLVSDQKTLRFAAPPGKVPVATLPRFMRLDRKGEVMVASDEGLMIFTGDGWQTLNRKSGLAEDSVSQAIEDQEGSIWLAIPGMGIVRTVGYRQWQSWTTADGLLDNQIWSIAGDRHGAIWVGAAGAVHKLSSTTGRVLQAWSKQQGLPAGAVTAIAVDSSDNIWMSHVPGGVSGLNVHTGVIRRYSRDAGLTDDRAMFLIFDHAGQLWVSTTSGLFRSYRVGPDLKFRQEPVPLTDPSEMFLQSLVDRRGGLWAAGNHGLAHLENGAWKRFSDDELFKSSESAMLTEGQDGSFWLGYKLPLGLTHFSTSGSQTRFERRFEPAEIGSHMLMFVGADRQGRIWAGLDNGVAVYDGVRWQHYSQPDGLIWNDTDSFAFFPDLGGHIWIGTAKGLARFTPEPDTGMPPVRTVIRSFQVGPNIFKAGAPPPSVKYRDGSFSAEFAALTYLNEKHVRFRYRLRGLEENWFETDQHSVRYGRLPAGSYEFEVAAAAANNGNTPPALPARVAFRVLHPWWESGWFLALAVAALAALIRLFLGWRIAKLKHDRKRLEKAVADRTHELAVEKARAEQSNIAKSAFLANMSHEIRTPMNGVLGALDLALEKAGDSEQRNYLEVGRSSAESLLELLNDILDFSKIEAGRIELYQKSFSLRDCLDGVVKLMAFRAREKGLDLWVDVSEDVPDGCVGDAFRLRQILINLVGNALKFTENGHIGIRVRTENVSTGDEPRVNLRFAVEDTGIGIPKDKQDVIFEAFRQSDASVAQSYGGTGLGLSICSRLVNLMNGRIWVDSTPGSGSVFAFTSEFGVARSAVDRASEPVETAEQVVAELNAGGALEVLLVDDNSINRLVARRLLEKCGFIVSVAENGQVALELSESRGFDLILMDVQMPVMNGLEATQAIRRRETATGLHVPILAMTANVMSEDRGSCLESGMDGFIGKPIKTIDLLHQIRRHVAPRGAIPA